MMSIKWGKVRVGEGSPTQGDEMGDGRRARVPYGYLGLIWLQILLCFGSTIFQVWFCQGRAIFSKSPQPQDLPRNFISPHRKRSADTQLVVGVGLWVLVSLRSYRVARAFKLGVELETKVKLVGYLVQAVSGTLWEVAVLRN